MALGGPWGLCKAGIELGWLLGAANCLLLLFACTGLFSVLYEVRRSAAMTALRVGGPVQGDPQTQLGRLTGSPPMGVSVLCPLSAPP